MSLTALYTKAEPYRRVLATNGTASAFAARTDSLTLPTTAGYITVPPCNTMLLKPYGTDADNETGSVRVYGVKAIQGSGATSYTHVLLGEWAFTLSSTLTGVAGGVVVATEYYADTITRTVGIENVADQVLSPTGDEPAHILVDCKGHTNLFVELITGGSAASVNALYAGV